MVTLIAIALKFALLWLIARKIDRAMNKYLENK